MLPGVAPGRGPPPGRGGAPGRGGPAPCGGRGAGRSTGTCVEKGLLPTRGARPAGLGAGPGRGPGVGPAAAAGAAGSAGPAGVASTCGGAGGAAATSDTTTGGAGGDSGAAGGRGAEGLGPPGLGDEDTAPPLVDAAPAADLGAGAAALEGAGFEPLPNASRSRRATGASTVEDADLTNSPCSLSRARTSLLVTPSSLANSCTRALPATTSPV